MADAVFVSASAEETTQHGRELGARLRAPVLVLLFGELGAGKTTFAKGIISGLEAAREEDVTSPTFTLVHVFQGRTRVHHVDLYRIEGFHDLETLGLEDVFSEPGVVIVEWPDRMTLRTDWPVVRVQLEHAGGDRRQITIQQAATTSAGPA